MGLQVSETSVPASHGIYTDRDSGYQVTVCRGNDSTALHKLLCNLSCDA